MIYINVFLFFLVALVYSSAGFGGGSLYLAILSGSELDQNKVAIIGLFCNLVVTVVSSAQFIAKGLVDWKKMFLLLGLSLPFSFFAGGLKVSAELFYLSLAAGLFLAALAMLIQLPKNHNDSRYQKWVYFTVPFIGLLSGLTGIGGGIYLAPLLHLTYWTDARRIAAITSIFIAVNSISGLVARSGFIVETLAMETSWMLLPAAVLVGGIIGSRLSTSLLHPKWIKSITAGILIFASVRLFIKWL